MNFEEAMKALREGKNIRIKSWRGHWWNVYYPDKFLLVREPKMFKPDSAIFVTEDMRACEEWEIVNEL